MIHLKKGVRLTPEMAMTVILNNANELFKLYDVPCVITSEKSKHYSFMALDFRGNHVSEYRRDDIIKKLREALGKDYDVIPSNAGAIHIEYDPKGPVQQSSPRGKSWMCPQGMCNVCSKRDRCK